MADPNIIDNPLAIASVSLGQHASHTLPDKITAASHNGISGIEITYPDLEGYARDCHISIVDAAQKIKELCAAKGIVIVSLAPFENFEGNPSPLSTRLETAKKWLTIARILGAEHLQVPSSFDLNTNNDHENIINELRQLSDLASASMPIIKIAYENLAWSTHCSLWQEAFTITKEVDRDNFGLCLDNFHFCAALWGDPFRDDGIQVNGLERYEQSLAELVSTCPLDKIFYIQLSDGELFSPPYSETHPWYDSGLAVGHVWSMHARPFPFETQYGAYMPVEQFARAVLRDMRFKGWVSLETFDRRMRNKEFDPARNAARAVASWRELKQRMITAAGVKL